MPSDSANLGARSGSLVETHTTFQPRVFFFYFMVGIILLVLAGGLAYRQLLKTTTYHDAERMQNQRRVLVPGPRGNIYDREGRLLVGNKPRFSVVLYLDELRGDFRREFIQIRKNYRESGDRDIPTAQQMERIARVTVVQRYLDQVNTIIGRTATLSSAGLARHFSRELLLPYMLINDLTSEEYARLIERLPVRSPLQVYTSSTRYYPNQEAAAHTLGFVGYNVEVEAEDFPGEDLTTFKMKGASGKDGLELFFDATLQGEPGGTIFRVDPSGYRINPPLARRLPVQGKNIITSIDLDIQLVTEEALGDQTGAAVMLDVNTGEVLAIASKPDRAQGEYINRALSGLYLPGSTFKLITSIAALRAGTMTPESSYTTDNIYMVGGKAFRDHRGCISGDIDFTKAIEHSVNTFFINFGLKTGVDNLAAEAKRFGLGERTGIELPYETNKSFVGTPDWKKKRFNENWYPGDTANLSFGQGFITVTPLQMACFAASLARNQVRTKPTLLRQDVRTTQKSDPIGLPAEQYRALIDAMEKVVGPEGSAGKFCMIDGLRIASKTGTAQQRTAKGTVEFAWFIGFAPADHPEVAWAVLIEGDTPDESYAGGRYAAPVAKYMLLKWLEKRNALPAAKTNLPSVSQPAAKQ